MSERYEDVTATEEQLLQDVIKEYFPHMGYENIAFKLIFDTKFIKKGAKYVFAYIKAMNTMSRFLTRQEANREDGFDYTIVFVKKLWDVIDEADKKRIMRHELRHVEVVDGNNPYKTQDHEITDFYADVEIESKPGGDIRWPEKLSTIVASLEEEEKIAKEAAKEAKKKSKG